MNGKEQTLRNRADLQMVKEQVPTADRENREGRLAAAIRPQGSSLRKGRSQDMARDVTRISTPRS